MRIGNTIDLYPIFGKHFKRAGAGGHNCKWMVCVLLFRSSKTAIFGAEHIMMLLSHTFDHFKIFLFDFRVNTYVQFF